MPAQTSRWRLTASLGFATAEPDEAGDIPDSAGLMRRADTAMYEDKRAGRNPIAAAPVEQPRDQPAPPDGRLRRPSVGAGDQGPEIWRAPC